MMSLRIKFYLQITTVLILGVLSSLFYFKFIKSLKWVLLESPSQITNLEKLSSSENLFSFIFALFLFSLILFFTFNRRRFSEDGPVRKSDISRRNDKSCSVTDDPVVRYLLLGMKYETSPFLSKINKMLSNLKAYKLDLTKVSEDEKEVVLKFSIDGIDHNFSQSVASNSDESCDNLQRAFEKNEMDFLILHHLIKLFKGKIVYKNISDDKSMIAIEVNFEKVTDIIVEKKDNDLREFPNYKGMRVLISEDNIINQEVLQTLLDDYEIESIITVNGIETLDCLAKDDDFDILLIDINMPVMGGVELAQEIHKMDMKKKYPLVAITANIFFKDEDDSKYFDYIIEKPINLGRFNEILKNITGEMNWI